MVGAGGDNIGGLSRDEGAVGVGDEAWVASGVDGGGGGDGEAVGGEVVGLGGGHSGLVNGDNSAIRVSDQLGVEVEGAGVAWN